MRWVSQGLRDQAKSYGGAVTVLNALYHWFPLLSRLFYLMAIAAMQLVVDHPSRAEDLHASVVSCAKSEPLDSTTRRVVALRYDWLELELVSANRQSLMNPEEFALFLVSDMQRCHASRAILPDPLASDHKDHWLAVSRQLVESGFDVWIELAPDSLGDRPVNSEKSIPILDPARSQQHELAILKRVRALSDLRTASNKAIVDGFYLPLDSPVALASSWEAGLNECTFGVFLQETGLEGEWSKRLVSNEDRRAFVRSAGLMPWLAWRSRRVADFYRSIANQTHETTGLKITFAVPSFASASARSLFEEAERNGVSPLVAWRWMAFEPSLWRSSESMELISSESIGDQKHERGMIAHPDLESALEGLSVRGHWLSQAMHQARGLNFVNGTMKSENPPVFMEAALVSHLSRHDLQWVLMDRSAIRGQESNLADWNRRFKSMPSFMSHELVTNVSLQGMTIRTFQMPKSMRIALINPLPCRMEVEMVASAGGLTRIDSTIEVTSKHRNDQGTTIRLTVGPKSWGSLDFGTHSEMGFEVSLPEESKDVIQTRYDELMEHRLTPQSNFLKGGKGADSASDKTLGRRLMAALQAYRESRLADFFRLSDGIKVEHRNNRGEERAARRFTEDLSNQPKIR